MSSLTSENLLYTADRPDIIMESGSGLYLRDTQGRSYLDFVGGWAVTCLGHSHPVISQALETQGRTLINASPSYLNQPQLAFAQQLCQLSAYDRVFFCSTGAEANESAIKLARKFGAGKAGAGKAGAGKAGAGKYGDRAKTGAYKIITMQNGFHGRTLATMSATAKPAWDQLFEPKLPGFIKVPYNNFAAVQAAIDPQVVAVMLEPVQGEAGVIEADIGYLQDLRALCDHHGLLLIFDEIQTGLGRLGSMFAFQQAGIRPDIVTLAKGIGGGFPLAAMLCTEALNIFQKGDQGGTFCGQALAMAVGRAVVGEIVAQNLAENARLMGQYLQQGLQELARRFPITAIRGRGLLQAIDVGGNLDGPTLVQACQERGLLINSPRPKTLRFMPALIVQKNHIDHLLQLLAEALSWCAAHDS